MKRIVKIILFVVLIGIMSVDTYSSNNKTAEECIKVKLKSVNNKELVFTLIQDSDDEILDSFPDLKLYKRKGKKWKRVGLLTPLTVTTFPDKNNYLEIKWKDFAYKKLLKKGKLKEGNYKIFCYDKPFRFEIKSKRRVTPLIIIFISIVCCLFLLFVLIVKRNKRENI